MTPEEIDQLTPGRDLDALIAERLFGYQWYALEGWSPILCLPEDKMPDRVPCDRPAVMNHNTGTHKVPFFSSDIRAAMRVVGHVMAGVSDTAQFALHWIIPGGGDAPVWECSMGAFWEDTDRPVGVGDTAPEAICKAALKVAAAPSAPTPTAEAE
jgi:hypothetical protein